MFVQQDQKADAKQAPSGDAKPDKAAQDQTKAPAPQPITDWASL